MPSPAGTVLSLLTRAWPLLLKYGPKAVAAFGVLSKFVADNPRIPTWFRERLEHLPTRLSDVQRRPGDAAKIRGTLEIIRDVARDAQKADERVDAEDYVNRADRIERGVKLAETQDRREQRALLGKLKADTDALLAELLEAVSGTPAGGAGTGTGTDTGTGAGAATGKTGADDAGTDTR
jgi:hypothetical protein